MAACQNVQTFCAAQVIYWTGMNGVDYVFNIFIADTSLMKNRLIWMAFTGLPYVVNTFVSISLFAEMRHKLTSFLRQDQSWVRPFSTMAVGDGATEHSLS